jgi:predicted ATP-grasp superfamily ATP-dependent carboligase
MKYSDENLIIETNSRRTTSVDVVRRKSTLSRLVSESIISRFVSYDESIIEIERNTHLIESSMLNNVVQQECSRSIRAAQP